MTKPVVSYWPAEVPNAYALSQNVASDGFMVLNGSYSMLITVSPYTPANPPYATPMRTSPLNPNGGPLYPPQFANPWPNPGVTGVAAGIATPMSRTVSLTSTTGADNTQDFIITGMYNGAPYSETLTGPAGNSTVETAGYYDTIFSIQSVGAAATAVAAGTGTSGHTAWTLFDWNRNATPEVRVTVTVDGTIEYSYGVTLDEVSLYTKSIPQIGTTTGNPYLFDPTATGALTNQTENAFGNFGTTTPFRYGTMLINSGTGGTAIATIIQQGV